MAALLGAFMLIGSGGGSESLPVVLLGRDGRLAVALREHVLRLLTLPVASVAYDRETHSLIAIVACKHLLEGRGESLELGLGGETGLDQTRLDLHGVLVDLQGRAFKIAGVLLGADSGVGGVVIGASVVVERARLLQVGLVVLHGRSLEVHAHHVFEVVAARSELGSVSDAATGCLLENLLVLRNETFLRLVVEPAQDLPLEALRCVVRVALAVEVLGVDAGDEAGVARDALVADVVHGAVHPADARLAHVAPHRALLGLFSGAVHRVRPHRVRNFLLHHHRGASVDH
eukprot:CAMPEP_0170465624 /NCGR_PEP_ID=MMETSP0123-20130129/9901_1 /TAXON_ID=182087 /ORGANISM="Favella ehrenbergii, Strain Fehren 1" /LENGTH=287 /DNA_ID=CAMNT_0010731573 /DNA_START=169 /DNA_END=1033 /DNA_ORIENTATION=-